MQFKKRIHFPVISSTNTYLKENYHHLENLTAVTASHQSAGRGRMDRTWFDGDDILLSILIKEDLKIDESWEIALVTAASIYNTLSKYVKNLKIKWPNDLLVNNKKVCGILIESIITEKKIECLIIGIGINVNTESFPQEIENKATSLKKETSKGFDINKLTEEIIDDFSVFYQKFKNNNREYMRICKENSCLMGKEVIIDDFVKTETGKVIDILENGNLLIDFGYELRQYNSGEVTLFKNY